MQQHRQLARHGNDRSLLPAPPAALGQFQAPAPQIAVHTERSQDMLRPLHQQRAQMLPAVGESALKPEDDRSALSGHSGKRDPEITDDDETRVRAICGEFWGKRVYLRSLSR